MRELEVSDKLCIVCMDSTSGFFLLDDRSMLLWFLLTRLSPGLPSLKLEDLVL